VSGAGSYGTARAVNYAEHRHTRMQRVTGRGQTGCSAVVDNAEWSVLGPKTCGFLASHPHPDPERTYLEPLCCRHYEEAEAMLVSADD
jgi:hypothetical protein